MVLSQQGDQVIAPLEIQLHLDGDEGNKFRMGTLGIGHDSAHAMQAAVAEWHLLVAAPVLAALGAPVSTRRTRSATQIGRLELFSWPLGSPRQAPGRTRSIGPVLSLGAGSACAGW